MSGHYVCDRCGAYWTSPYPQWRCYRCGAAIWQFGRPCGCGEPDGRLLAENQQAHIELTQAHANIDQLLAELKRQEGILAENQRLREIVEIVKRRRARFLHDVDRNDEERRLDELLEALTGDGA